MYYFYPFEKDTVIVVDFGREMSVVGLAGEVVKSPGDRSFNTSKLVLMKVAKMNVKNPQLKDRKPVFTLIRAEKFVILPVSDLSLTN